MLRQRPAPPLLALLNVFSLMEEPRITIPNLAPGRRRPRVLELMKQTFPQAAFPQACLRLPSPRVQLKSLTTDVPALMTFILSVARETLSGLTIMLFPFLTRRRQAFPNAFCSPRGGTVKQLLPIALVRPSNFVLLLPSRLTGIGGTRGTLGSDVIQKHSAPGSRSLLRPSCASLNLVLALKRLKVPNLRPKVHPLPFPKAPILFLMSVSLSDSAPVALKSFAVRMLPIPNLPPLPRLQFSLLRAKSVFLKTAWKSTLLSNIRPFVVLVIVPLSPVPVHGTLMQTIVLPPAGPTLNAKLLRASPTPKLPFVLSPGRQNPKSGVPRSRLSRATALLPRTMSPPPPPEALYAVAMEGESSVVLLAKANLALPSSLQLLSTRVTGLLHRRPREPSVVLLVIHLIAISLLPVKVVSCPVLTETLIPLVLAGIPLVFPPNLWKF